MSFTIFHNPRCSKSRAALSALEATGAPITVVKYLDTPPSAPELEEILHRGGLTAHEVIRREEALYKELGLTADSTESELIAAMAANPILINRPLVIRDSDGKAALGRPLDAVMELIAGD